MAGNNSTVGLETVTFTDNMSFDGTERGGAMTTDGELWIGSTSPRHVRKGSITSPNGTITVGYSAPNITLDLAGGSEAIDSIAVQTGTSPIFPDANGLVNINGAVVASGTNPVRSDGTGPNTLAIEVQTSQALAAADATKIGLCNFDSSSFAVAATGFVTASGTGLGKTITGQSGGALSPTAGNWNISGGTVAAGTTPVATSGSGSTLTTNVQISQAIAAADSTKIGLCNFDSASFAVAATGFVTLQTTYQWAQVSRQTASSSANINFNDLVAGAQYQLYWEMSVNATNTQSLNMLLSTDNGSTFLSSDIRSAIQFWNDITSTTLTNLNSTTFVYLTNVTSNARHANGSIFFSAGARMSGRGQFVAATTTATSMGEIMLESTLGTNVINGIRIQASSGNIASGTFTLYRMV